MRENYDAVGFIPEPTVRDRYIRRELYLLQKDSRGNRIGYLLHGPIEPGKPVVVSQHCIQYEKRMLGYGRSTFKELLKRCRQGGASSIHLRCADDLPAVQFWQTCGFQVSKVTPGGQKRHRMIIEMNMLLNLPLFERDCAQYQLIVDELRRANERERTNGNAG